MKRFSTVTMLLAAIAIGGVPYAWVDRSRRPRPIPIFQSAITTASLGSAVLKHRVRHRSAVIRSPTPSRAIRCRADARALDRARSSYSLRFRSDLGRIRRRSLSAPSGDFLVATMARSRYLCRSLAARGVLSIDRKEV